MTRWPGWIALLTAAGVAAPAGAQLFGGLGVPLGPAYVDSSFGFSVQPPKGWHVSTARAMGAGDDTLVRMTSAAPGDFPPELSVRFSAPPRDRTIDQWLDDYQHERAGWYKDLALVGRQTQRLAGRPGGRMTLRFTQEGRPRISYLAVMRVRARGYFVITYTGPATEEKPARRVFDAVLGSFRLHADEGSDEMVKAAFRRGKAWMDGLRSVDLASKVQPAACLTIAYHDKDRGYVLITEEPFTYQKTPGVRIVEDGWTFDEGGEAQHLLSQMFLSLDRSLESWRHTLVLLNAARDSQPVTLEMTWEEGLRDHDALITAQSYQYGQSPENNPHLKLPEGYLSRVLLRWMPRLADPSQPGLHAFSGFDHQRAALVLRTVEFKGRQRSLFDASSEPRYLVVDREGLSGPPVEMLFDGSGRLKRYTAGALRMEPADRAATVSRWQSRVTESARRMRELGEEYDKSLKRMSGK